MTLDFRPLDAHGLAAEVVGLDLRKPLADEQVEAIQALQDRHPVVCFRRQPLTDDHQQAFISRFGPAARPALSELSTGESRRHPHLFDVATVDEHGQPIRRNSAYDLYMRANQLWHSDGSQSAVPIRLTALSARVLPPAPPPTEYADMRAAYEALPPSRRDLLDGLVAEHSILASRAKVGMRPEDFTEESRRQRPVVPHPLVRRHPRTGRKSLYLSSHAFRIRGMDDAAGEALLAELTAWATQPRFVYAHAWQPDDLVMWDNSVTMHRATPYQGAEPRLMRWSGAQEPAPV